MASRVTQTRTIPIPAFGKALRCLATGRTFTVIKKRKPKGGYSGGVKVVHLKGGHTEMSVRVDLITNFFEVLK